MKATREYTAIVEEVDSHLALGLVLADTMGGEPE